MMEKLEDYREKLLEYRHWLHQHPELSMEEIETSRYIAGKLKEQGISCRITGKTGVIGDLTVDPSLPTMALRAEIDALPIMEKTGLSFASCYPGKMHGCGHDAITAVVLCLASVLNDCKDSLKYNIRFLFEPAEETGEGAGYMISHGALEDPRPDGILVFHYGNQEAEAMEIQKSISTAAVGGLRITVRGRSSHWSQREEGVDAMAAAAMAVMEIQDINENLRTVYPFVLGFGWLQAGTARNIMAEHAVLEGSLRTFSEEDFQKALSELEKRLDAIGKKTGAELTVELIRKIPPIINDASLVEKGIRIGRKQFGKRFYLGEKPFLVGDNAACYMERIPGMRMVFLAGKKGEEAYPVHNPGFDIDEEGLMDALKFLVAFLCDENDT